MSIMGRALRSSCIQDVPQSRPDVSLHNTAAFRPLLLFRLHDDSHQALTFFGLSLVSRQRRRFSLASAAREHTRSFVWTLRMMNICTVARSRRNATECVGEVSLPHDKPRRGSVRERPLKRRPEASGGRPCCESSAAFYFD